MKKFTLLATMLFSSISLSMMAYDVSTEPQKKNVLLEDFTGIHCGYCPQAHVIAHDLNYLHPSRIFPVAIHSGYYAIPGPDEPDFRTADGDAIDNGLGTTSAGRPCGVLNRRSFGSGNSASMVLSRGVWSQTCKDMLKEDAPVNLLIKSECDASTRELTITIEGYCTGDMPSPTAFLSVAMTQDNITGPQNGGGVGSDYVHQSMLRDYISDVWGDEIEVAKGEYFTKEYTYTLPEYIYAPQASNGIFLNLPDINILAFVTEDGKNEVLNVVSAKPEYKNLDMPVSACISKPLLGVSKKYGFNYVEVVLTNTSVEAITSAEFEVKINGVSQTSAWEGEVPAMSWAVVKVPYTKDALKDYNTWSVALQKANNQDVIKSEISGTFSAPAAATSDVRVTIQTDANTDENIWRILDEDGNVVKVFEPEEGKATLIKEIVELEQDKIYCFEVIDIWSDGIDGGSFKLNNSDSSLIEQNYAIPTAGYRTFFNTSKTSVDAAYTSEMTLDYNAATRILSISESAQVSIYSADGMQLISTAESEVSLSQLRPGLYIAVATNGAATQVKKLVIQ